MRRRRFLVLAAVVLGSLGLTGCASALRRSPGVIVLQSNRDGSFDIYVMNADGMRQTRLTNNPYRDLHPDWR